jgi:hypothetical protein
MRLQNISFVSIARLIESNKIERGKIYCASLSCVPNVYIAGTLLPRVSRARYSRRRRRRRRRRYSSSIVSSSIRRELIRRIG